MGLYLTIDNDQIKCFSIPCRPISSLNEEISFYLQNEDFEDFDFSNIVPYQTLFYNYGKNFAIFNFYCSYSSFKPYVIFIKNGKVTKIKYYEKIKEKDFKDINLVIDNSGKPLKISDVSDFTEIIEDFRIGYAEYRILCDKYRRNKSNTENDSWSSRAFNETIELLNNKWFYDENSDIYKQMYSGFHCGYILENLLDENYSIELKRKSIELFEEYCKNNKQHSLDEEINLYYNWLKTFREDISLDFIKEHFFKYQS